jgi:hypothetical protein
MPDLLSRNTRHRWPSNFGSNSHPSREKALAVKVASIGSKKSGILAFRARGGTPAAVLLDGVATVVIHVPGGS